MRLGVFAIVAAFFCSVNVHAFVLSPTSKEVKFSYTAEFQSQESGPSQKLVDKHSQHLFGYMQSPQLAAKFGINKRTVGWGAPAWPPKYEILEATKRTGVRRIRYRVEGIWMMNIQAAEPILRNGFYDIILPYDLDNYWQAKCVMDDEPDRRSSFSYFYNPYKPGCESLLTAPLAAEVRVKVEVAENVDQTATADLDKVRGDNGNGSLFEIMSVTGFEEKGNRGDMGRASFVQINDWLEQEGFEKSVVQAYKYRTIFQFDKDMLVPGQGNVHVRITRLLSSTDLDKERTTFSKFFKKSIKQADVVMYAGHSGSSFVLEAEEIEKHAGKLEFDKTKNQIFFFDACSGYSYFLPMFHGRKDPGTLSLLSFALTSQFGYERPMHKAFLRYLFDMKEDHPQWMDMMTDMEKVLRGMTFMLNVQVL